LVNTENVAFVVEKTIKENLKIINQDVAQSGRARAYKN